MRSEYNVNMHVQYKVKNKKKTCRYVDMYNDYAIDSMLFLYLFIYVQHMHSMHSFVRTPTSVRPFIYYLVYI